ncbi:hypothetical protein [uncultured Maribacter sp.]|uniref:hypothetical protein n=1 Tax=uncultured Maribacter sp. TaxID=431308 RepID=UPI0030EE8EC5|tara:strand:+ start:40070 stop:40867 length:798 start_codon:yes stop_codon:yes gene_type:complete
MNKFFIIVLAFVVFACKDAPKKEASTDTVEKKEMQVAQTNYPKELFKVFEAHGGLEKWKSYRTLSFDMPKDAIIENQVIDLKKRTDKITTPTATLGFDGTEVWLLDPTNTYKGKPKFYHNLMFYFYTMPFVFADNGLNYEAVAPLVVDGITYPGYKITYDTGIGASSTDEYYIHYDSETFEMRWLGYTMTYFSGEPSDKVNWINYNDWVKVDEVLLPKSITWQMVEDDEIKGPAKTVSFENASLSKSAMPNNFYSKPENAKVITE